MVILVCLLQNILLLLSTLAMPTVLLIRHAHRLDFIQPQWFETAAYPYDPPLSALGWQQALELAPKLLHLPIELILTSPYLRTLQTAYPLGRGLGLKLCIENGLREWLHPEWSPALPETLPLGEKILQVPTIDLEYAGIFNPQYPETSAAINIRGRQVAERLIGQSDRCAAIVAHKHVLLGMLMALVPRDLQLPEILPATALVLYSVDRSMGSWQIHNIL
jgi:broad specificity phosphatase PhoE